MYEAVKSRGKKVFIHSCGKVDELFPDLIDSGLDVFNPFQPEVIDVEEAKRRYGDRLSFYGGISTQKTLPYGSTTEVTEEVRRLLDRVGKKRGLHRGTGARRAARCEAREHRRDDRRPAEPVAARGRVRPDPDRTPSLRT